MSEIQRVKRAAAKAARSRAELETAMLQAHLAGQSTRKIAEAAGVSHTQVQRTIRSDQT